MAMSCSSCSFLKIAALRGNIPHSIPPATACSSTVSRIFGAITSVSHNTVSSSLKETHGQSVILVSLTSQPPATIQRLSIPVDSPLRDFHLNRILQREQCCDWLLFTQNLVFKAHPGQGCVGISFLCIAKLYSAVWTYHTSFIHRWMDIGRLPTFCLLWIDWCCCEHSCTSFCVDEGFHFCWLHTKGWNSWVICELLRKCQRSCSFSRHSDDLELPKV